MNKRYVCSSVIGLILFLGFSIEGHAQHKGISFQAVLKRSDGSYPTVSGISVTAQVLDPQNHCILREEEHSGKNISNGYLNLVLGDSAAATPGIRNPSPVLSLSQVLDNKTTRTNLKCVDLANNIISSGQSYIPSNVDRRVLRIRLNVQGEDIVADFNMRSVGFAVNSEMLNSKSDTDFINVNNLKGVVQSNLESIFDRFTKLDAILNGFNAGGTSAGINITGNASTATTATNVSGTVAIANGGTGATTASGARTSLGLGSLATMSPTGTADNTTYLRGDGTWQTVSAGSSVTSVAGRTGAVTLSTSDVSGLGSLATKATSGTADNTTYLRGDGAWTALGGAASLNVGTGVGTVAAGNDSRITGAVQNAGSDAASNVAAFSAGLDVDKPGSPVAGQMYVATDEKKIYRYDGSSWITVAQVGGTGFSGSLAGDVSGAQGTTVVDKIKGQAVTATASTAGQVLRYAGGNNWTPGFVAMTDLRSTVTGSNSFANSCAANQTLTYNSVGDVMSCQAITGVPAANITGLHTVATSGSYNDLSNKPTIPAAQVNADWSAVSGVAQILNKPTLGSLAAKSSVDLSGADATGVIDDARLPASAKYWTAATGGINYGSGNVGMGTTAPKAVLDVYGAGSGASVANTGATDSTTNARIGRGSVGINFGMLDNGVGYVQNRQLNDNSVNYNLSIQPNGGNVGIGTTNPGAKLDVNGVVNLNNNKITNVATPTASADAATKAYVDAAGGSSGMPTMISAESAGTYTTANANLYCDGLNTANSGNGTVCEKKKGNTACDGTQYNTSWRLPSAEELGYFLGYTASTNYLWTRSVYYGGDSYFVTYRLDVGAWTGNYYNNNYYVRCVR